MQALKHAHRQATWWLVALVGSIAALLAAPAIGQAEEANPNNYTCAGSIAAGSPEVGNEEQQVAYSFHCNGPITGYQLESQNQITGVEASPLVSNIPTGKPLTDTFSCSGELPGFAANCVGATKAWYETISGQFSIGTKICSEPRVDPLLTVTYAYLEKGVVTQAISGPFDLGRPTGCPPTADSGFDRLNPRPVALGAKGEHGKKGKRHGQGKPKNGAGAKQGCIPKTRPSRAYVRACTRARKTQAS